MEDCETKDNMMLDESSDGKAEDAEERKWFPSFERINLNKIAVYSVLAFGAFVQLFLLLTYLFGMGFVSGQRLTVLSAMDAMIRIFGITRVTVYHRISGFLIGGVYLLTAGLLIKNTWDTVKNLFGFFKKRHDGSDSMLGDKCFKTVVRSGIDSFVLVCASLVLFGLLTNIKIQSTFMVATVLAAIMIAIRALLPCIGAEKGFDWTVPCCTAIREILIFVTICFLLSLLEERPIEKIFVVCRMLFNGNSWGDLRTSLYALYVQIASPILSVVFAVMILHLLHGYYNSWARGKTLAASILKTFRFVLVCVILHFVFHVFINVNIGTVSLKTMAAWWETVKSGYVPILILLGVWRWLELRSQDTSAE